MCGVCVYSITCFQTDEDMQPSPNTVRYRNPAEVRRQAGGEQVSQPPLVIPRQDPKTSPFSSPALLLM